ncbi:MAG: 30S ribosomal protein S17 [Myxococcales bacterium]|nr:30S ribosomal protein S17 [Myxococcales bacterium]
MADATELKTPAGLKAKPKEGFRRKLVGLVMSNKMDKTVVVEVTRSYVAPKYKKYVRSRARYKAHDPKNEYLAGDRVEIQECSPISREKSWVVTRLVSGSSARQVGGQELPAVG